MALIETATAATTTTTATSVTVTLAGAPTAGEKLVAVVHSTDDYPDTPSGWTLDKEKAGTGVIRLFSKTASGSEGTSLVFTAPTAGGMTARVMRYSGLGAIDSSATGATSGTGTFNTGFLTTTQASTFLIAAGSPHATTLPTDDVAPSSGFTKIAADIKSTNSGNRSQLHVSTGTAATAAAYDFTGTYTPAVSTTAESVLVAYATASGDVTVTAVAATGAGSARPPSVSGGSTGAVTAVKATGTGLAVAPAVSASSSATVAAVKATGTGAAPIPVVTVTTTITGGGAATGTGAAIPPTVTAVGPGSVVAVKATGTGAARVPAVTTGATVTAVKATGTGLVRVPSVSGGAVTSLPAAVTFGSVKGWLAQGVNQSPDADGYADLVADQGTVTFTPNVSVLLFPSASPDPLILTPKVVVATLDADGYLVGTKTGGTEKLVRLIVGTWTVTYQLTGVTLPSHPITITAGTTVDLIEVIPT